MVYLARQVRSATEIFTVRSQRTTVTPPMASPSDIFESIGRLRTIIEDAEPFLRDSPGADFLTRDPATLSAPARVLQATNRFICDRWAAIGSSGAGIVAGAILDPVCAAYLGEDAPQLSLTEPNCSDFTITYTDRDVASPGQPEQGPFTAAGLRPGFVIEKSSGPFAGFQGGCIYAQNPDGTSVPLSCTNFPQFNADLEILSSSLSCTPNTPFDPPQPSYPPTRPVAPPIRRNPGIPEFPDLEIDVDFSPTSPDITFDFGDGPRALGDDPCCETLPITPVNVISSASYTIVTVADGQSQQGPPEAIWFFPRIGSIVFFSAEARSELIAVNSTEGTVVNPQPGLLDQAAFIPYLQGTVATVSLNVATTFESTPSS